jgi:hypothetical protein
MLKMVLPELTSKLVETKLTAYCERRVPPHARDQVRMSFSVRGNNVTINEERVAFKEPGRWVTIPIAQLRFTEKSGLWTLYCADRNDRWHLYRHAEPAKDVGALLGAMDADKTGIFFG